MTLDPLEIPKISIIVPIYNHLDYVVKLAESVAKQTYQSFQLVLSNDCSTEFTSKELCSKVLSICPDRLCGTDFLEHTGNPSTVRNAGAKMATGEFLVFPDSDVVLYDNFLARMMANMSDSVDIVYCNWKIRKVTDKGHTEESYFGAKSFSPAELRRGNYISICSLVRKSKFLGFNEDLIGLEDWEMWLRMVKNGSRGFHVPEVLFTHYDRCDSLTKSFNYWDKHNYVLSLVDSYDINNLKCGI